MEARRIYWIDNMKAIGIFLVVFGHYVNTPVAKAYVYSFHMHLFFFLAGYVYSGKDSFRTLLVKRTRMLIVPYLAFSGLSYAVFLLRRPYGYTPDMTVGVVERFVNILTWNEFWFLGCLFLVSIAFWFFAGRIRTIIRLAVFAVSCTALHFVLSRFFSDYLHENLLKCPTGLAFYALGFFSKDWLERLKLAELARTKPHIPLLVLTVNLCIFYPCYKTHGLISIAFSGNYFYYYALSLTGIFNVFVLANLFEKNTYFSFVGKNTILIYLMEGYPRALVWRFMYYAFRIDNFHAISSGSAFLYSALAILILTPFIVFINRFLPFLIGRRRPRRTGDAEPVTEAPRFQPRDGRMTDITAIGTDPTS